MGAKDIIEALDEISFDRERFMKAIIDYSIGRGLDEGQGRIYKELDLNEVTDKLIHIADKDGLIKPWMDELISMLTAENAHDLLLNAVKDEVEKWLEENDLQKMVDEWLGEASGNNSASGQGVKTVARLSGRSFFSVYELENGRIVAGDYCLGEDSRLYQIGKGQVAQVQTGESIIAIMQHGGKTYLTTENQGRIYKDGGDYKFKQLHKMKLGNPPGAFGCGRVLGKNVFVGREIYVEGLGVVKDINGYYCKDVIEYKAKAYIPGQRGNDAGFFVSDDCRSWSWEGCIQGAEFIKADATENGVWLVGQQGGNAALWNSKNMSFFRKVGSWPDFGYASCVKCHNHRAYIGLTKGWRSQKPGARLLCYPDKPIYTSAEAEMCGIACTKDYIYVATRTDRKRGKIVRISY